MLFLLIGILESFVQIGLPLLYYLVIHYDALKIFLQLLLMDNFQRLLRSLDCVDFSLQLLNLCHLFLLFFEFQLFHGKVIPRRGAGSQNIIWSHDSAPILLRHWASTRTLLGNIVYIVVDLFVQLANLIALKLKVLFILSHLICIVLHFVNLCLLVPQLNLFDAFLCDLILRQTSAIPFTQLYFAIHDRGFVSVATTGP